MQRIDFSLVIVFCQTSKEGDGANRIGSESDVLDYVEARINLSLAELATHTVDAPMSTGDDSSSTGDDVKVCIDSMLCRLRDRNFFASFVA